MDVRQRRLLAMVTAVVLAATACSSGSAAQRSPGSSGPASTHATRTPAPSPDPVTDLRFLSASRVGVSVVFAIATWTCGSGDSAACAGVFHSTDGGRSWSRTAAPGGALGEDASLSFADARQGWLLVGRSEPGGGVVYVTHDGGSRWQRLGLRAVTALVTAGASVYLVAGHRLYADAGSGDAATAVAPSVGDGLLVDHGAVYNYADHAGMATVPLVREITGRTVVDRAVPSGCRTSYSAAMAGLPDGRLVLVCGSEPGTGNQLKAAYGSADHGINWYRLAPPPSGGYVSRGAGGTSGVFVTGDRMALVATHDGGRTWAVAISGSNTAGGFSEVRFTDGRFGSAVDGGPPAALFLSDDGGSTWHTAPSPVVH